MDNPMLFKSFLISITMAIQPSLLYKFSDASSSTDWVIVNDIVMGGKSSGKFYINQEKKGVFEGYVSLENNGGFSSLRYRLKKGSVKKHSMLVLKVKGDGKKYQFRIKEKLADYYSYATYFTTLSCWQTIKIPLKEMYPTFRGNRLNMANYHGDTIEEIAFLIGNKKAEEFKLEIDFITLE